MNICTIQDCKRKSVSRTWCARHYSIFQRHGDPLYKKQFKKNLKCAVAECERKQVTKGHCSTHYMKIKRTGTLEKVNFTPEWGKRNSDARRTELSKIDSTPSQTKRRGYHAVNTVSDIKAKARNRGIDWTLTHVETYYLIIADCQYCGQKANWPNGRNGIDRIVNEIGYYKDNCVTCCSQCNSAKRDLSIQEFKNWICRMFWKTTTIEDRKRAAVEILSSPLS